MDAHGVFWRWRTPRTAPPGQDARFGLRTSDRDGFVYVVVAVVLPQDLAAHLFDSTQ